MRKEHADAERAHPGRLNLGEAKRPLEHEQGRQRAEHETDVERDAVAPSRPLDHHQGGEQDDRPLGEPLEDGL